MKIPFIEGGHTKKIWFCLMLVLLLAMGIFAAPRAAMAADPIFEIVPTSWDFGEVYINGNSLKVFTITNLSLLDQEISKIYISGPVDFITPVTNPCVKVLSYNESCEMEVYFHPLNVGEKFATIVIEQDRVVELEAQLSGTGIPVKFDPTSLDFGNQTVGTTSYKKDVSLINVGPDVLNITNITTNGEFTQTNNCGSSLASHTACTISTTFSPTSEGAKSGKITVTTNTIGSPYEVALSGNGTSLPVTVNLNAKADPNPADCNQDITFTAQLASTGTAAAENVVGKLAAPLPEGFELVSLTTTQGTCDNGTLSCNIGKLDPAKSATITAVGTFDKAGAKQITIEVSADTLAKVVKAIIDLVINDVNCGGGGGGGCSFILGGFNGTSLIPLGLLVTGLVVFGVMTRRKQT